MAATRRETITSLANGRLKKTLKLRKSRERVARQRLLAEGRREVERAFAAGLVCEELWTCSAFLGDAPPCLGACGIQLEASAAVFQKLAWHEKPEGVLGVFESPRWTLGDLPAPAADALYLVAVGTEKPGNLGAMVRTASAAGAAAVLAVGPGVDVFNPSAIRNSTGAVFSLPTVLVPEPADARDWLQRHGVHTLAAVAPDPETNGVTTCFEADCRFPLAVVVGPEHAGLDAAWRESSSQFVTIPMQPDGPVDSLNASNAAAILLYEAVRRRSML